MPKCRSLPYQRYLDGSSLWSDYHKESEVDLKIETLFLTKVVNQRKRLELVGLMKSSYELIVINVSVQVRSGVAKTQDQQKKHGVDLGNGCMSKLLVGEEMQGSEGEPDTVEISSWPKCDGSSAGKNPTAGQCILCGME